MPRYTLVLARNSAEADAGGRSRWFFAGGRVMWDSKWAIEVSVVADVAERLSLFHLDCPAVRDHVSRGRNLFPWRIYRDHMFVAQINDRARAAVLIMTGGEFFVGPSGHNGISDIVVEHVDDAVRAHIGKLLAVMLQPVD